MKKVWLLIAVVLVSYTFIDIFLWQRVFEDQARYSSDLQEAVRYYHIAWQMALFGLIGVGSIALLPGWKKAVFFAVATVTLAHSGLEDLLYYLFDGRSVPQLLVWLDEAPLILGERPIERWDVIVSAVTWLMVWFLIGQFVSASES